MEKFQVILFYTYVHIENPAGLADEQRAVQTRLSLTGRTLIAHEGINATLEGTARNIAAYLQIFLGDPRFAKTHIKKSVGIGTAFAKCVVQVKPEIVSLGLGSCDINPNLQTGIHLSPEELHAWIHSDKEFYIVDMRNVYEQQIGHFKGSVLPPMDNFRDLPKFVHSLSHLKHKTVVTVCTGGVRCEKASGYVMANGFTHVYQLDGGIVSYMERYPNEDFLGKLYVFDNRMAMGFYTDDPKHQIMGKCSVCEKPCERFTNCANDDCHRQTLACEACQEQKGKDFLCAQGCKIKTRNNATARKEKVKPNSYRTYLLSRLLKVFTYAKQ